MIDLCVQKVFKTQNGSPPCNQSFNPDALVAQPVECNPYLVKLAPPALPLTHYSWFLFEYHKIKFLVTVFGLVELLWAN